MVGYVAPAPAAPQRVLLLDLEPLSVAKDDAKALDRLLLAELGRVQGIEVVSAAEIRRMAALEGEKQSLGCDDEGCLAELAGAMGARLVVFGTVSTLGERTTMTLSLFDAASAGAIKRASVDGRRAADLAPLLRAPVRELLDGKGFVFPPDEEPAWSPGPLVWIGGAATGVGVIGALGAGVTIIVAESMIQVPTRDAGPKSTLQTVGRIAIVGAGVAALVAAGGGTALAFGMVE